MAVVDMDKAVFKMIEGKEYKERVEVLNKSLEACDETKTELKNANSLLKSNLSVLQTQNFNLTQNVTDWKKVAENEKSRGIRRGFFGFVKGVGVTVAVVGVLYFIN